MVLPLLLIMVLPKLMNAADPEAQKVKNLSFIAIDESMLGQGVIM